MKSREMLEILQYIRLGMSVKEIAEKRQTSRQAVYKTLKKLRRYTEKMNKESALFVTIKNWDVSDNPRGLVEFLQEIWHWDNYIVVKKGFNMFKEAVIKVELHTGGWSGNEDIIRALRETYFFFFYWQSEHRGGHYYFEIKKSLWEKGK